MAGLVAAASGMAVHAEEHRAQGRCDLRTTCIDITPGPLAGRSFKTPTGTTRAVVAQLQARGEPQIATGWFFWMVDDRSGRFLQYARARICSIFRRAGISPEPSPKRVVIREPIERALAIELVAFGGVVDEVAASLEFHRLAQYLYTLASTFTSFYEKCPVLKADAEIRESRLVLCDLTARTLKTGLGLLGIESPDQM